MSVENVEAGQGRGAAYSVVPEGTGSAEAGWAAAAGSGWAVEMDWGAAAVAGRG